MAWPDARGRPRAITLIGWLFIAVGAIGILKDVVPLATTDHASQLAALRAQGIAELGPAWTSRLLAALGGVGLLRGHPWARWLLAGWMGFHLVLSALHDRDRLLVHVAFFAPILYLLFRPRPGAP